MKLWNVLPLDKSEAAEIQRRYDLPPIIAMLLSVRNIKTPEQIEDFLSDEANIADPFEIKDMDKAVKRISRAVENCEPICVYGDYDADGVTSTALMYSYLETIGGNVMYYIPSRETEGYGMNKKAVNILNEKGIKLIITVDNGIAAGDEIDYASKFGIDTVVTDHHLPVGKLPDACAVVDLHRNDCPSKFKHLSGVGVAFKVIMALEGEYCDVDSLLDNYADLLAIGTIGDIVELSGENRVFVKRGIQRIMNSERTGLNALIESSGLSGKTISSGSISYSIVPRINAVGRLGLSGKSVTLLMTEDEEEAEQIASSLSSDNAERREIERNIFGKINLMIQNDPSLVTDRIIVIDGEGWHQGVIGIVAARIKEIYGKPVIVISTDGENARASGRSIEGFPLCDAVFACADLLEHYGGHPMAVGLSIKTKNIPLFRKKINDFARNFPDFPYEKLTVDCKLNPACLDADLVRALSYLQPYGQGNPTPVFGLYNMTVKNIIPLSNNKHLKNIFTRDNSNINAMKFFTSVEEFPYRRGDVLDLAVTLGINEYNGNKSVSVVIKEIKPSSVDNEYQLESLRRFEELCCGEKLSARQINEIMPNRNDFALLYRFLKRNNGYKYPAENLIFRLDNKLSFGKIKVILKAMSELGLAEVAEDMRKCTINLLQVSGKVDLRSAPVMRKLLEGSR